MCFIQGFHSDVSDGNDKESTESADVTEAGGFDDGSTAEDSKNVDPTDVVCTFTFGMG